MKKLIYVLIILTYTQPIFGQETKEYLIIEGKIFAEGSTLMYASIGIVNKNIGTITDDNGKFILEIPSIFSNESLTVSHIGYQTKQISINDILNKEFIEIKLIPKGIKLNEVIVTANRKRKNKLKEFGNRKKHDMFLWLKEGDKGSEIVTLIKPDSEILLKSVSLNILNENAEEFTLLLNIYDIDSITNFPKNQQLERQKVIKSKQTKGWLNINLSEENITIRKPFYIGFQWTDIDKPIPLVGGKIKESNNSLIRYKVLGTWEKYAEWDIKVEAETYK